MENNIMSTDTKTRPVHELRLGRIRFREKWRHQRDSLGLKDLVDSYLVTLVCMDMVTPAVNCVMLVQSRMVEVQNS
jgi:hypothetical protein